MTRRKNDVRGVYAIRTEDGRCYVGSSEYTHQRLVAHRTRLRCRRHPNKFLQAAWDERGPEAFSFEIVELLAPDADRFAAEQRWIDQLSAYEAGYNIAPRAGSSSGLRHTPDTRAKISAVKTGLRQSPETCAKRRASLKDLYCDPDKRLQLSLALKGTCAGEKNSQAKLTQRDVAAIRELAAQGIIHREIAARFGVQRQTIGGIVAGKRWPSPHNDRESSVLGGAR